MNYAIDTPTKRNMFVPENDIPFAPAYQPKPASELDQSHRNMTWLQHRPQTITAVPKSARDKKK